VVDFAKFAQALMTSKLLSADTTRMMWTQQPFKTGQLSDYGLGVRVSGEGNDLKIWHSGSQEETKTRMVLYPNQKHGMVIMCNTRHADAAKISTAIYKAL
jgi:CubicO group peptidase (beta-lactamase class C family)